MKILHINSSISTGGAAKAAYRLHKALLNLEHQSFFLHQNLSLSNEILLGPKTNLDKFLALVNPVLDRLITRFFSDSKSNVFSLSNTSLHRLDNVITTIKPDIIHLHWINDGMLKIEQLKKLNIPIVWTTHDIWPVTGGCHQALGCIKYTSTCKECPQTKNILPIDLTHHLFKRKKNIYNNIDLTFISPSSWMLKIIRQSSLTSKNNCVKIANGVDLSVFKPIDKNLARSVLNIKNNKKIILFGAFNPFKNTNKGIDIALKAINEISNEIDNIELMIFGDNDNSIPSYPNFRIRNMGVIQDEIALSILYSAADITLSTSTSESFGLTALESIACGTPVVCFNNSGMVDIIDHLSNGYTAEYPNDKDIKNGIEWILTTSDYQKISMNARAKAIKLFDINNIATQHISLYQSLLATRACNQNA